MWSVCLVLSWFQIINVDLTKMVYNTEACDLQNKGYKVCLDLNLRRTKNNNCIGKFKFISTTRYILLMLLEKYRAGYDQSGWEWLELITDRILLCSDHSYFSKF